MPNSAKPTSVIASDAEAEIASLQQPQLDQRLLYRQLDPDESGKADDRDDGEA